MKRARVIGEYIYLRPLERSDLTEDYLDWMNDLSISGHIRGAGFPVTRQRLEASYDASQGDDAVMFAICDRANDQHIGNARLSYIDWQNRVCRYGRLIGNRDYLGKGFGTDVLIQLLRFGFQELGMNRIWTAVVADNEASIQSNEKAGMTREGILREFVWANGSFRDAWSISMLRREFDERHGTPQAWAEKEQAWLEEARKNEAGAV